MPTNEKDHTSANIPVTVRLDPRVFLRLRELALAESETVEEWLVVEINNAVLRESSKAAANV